MTTSPPTWDQVIATKHWHACDLDTHTLTQCSQLARRDDALDCLYDCTIQPVTP